MNIIDYCNTLGIKDIGLVSEEELYSLYRSKLKQNHPDKIGQGNGGEEATRLIVEAHRALKKHIKELEVYRRLEIESLVKQTTIMLSIEDIMNIENGTEYKVDMTLKGCDVTRYLNKNNISDYKVVVGISYGLKTSIGNTSEIKYIPYNKKNEYRLSLNVSVQNMSTERIEINIMGEQKYIELSYSITEIQVNKNGIKVTLILERMVQNG